MAKFKHEYLEEQTELLAKFTFFEETFMRLQEAYIREAAEKEGKDFDAKDVEQYLITEGNRTAAMQLDRMEAMYRNHGFEHIQKVYGVNLESEKGNHKTAFETIKAIHENNGRITDEAAREDVIAKIEAKPISGHQYGNKIDIRDDPFFEKRGGDEYAEQRMMALKHAADIHGFKLFIEPDHIDINSTNGSKSGKTEADYLAEHSAEAIAYNKTEQEKLNNISQRSAVGNIYLTDEQINKLNKEAAQTNQVIENQAPAEEIEAEKNSFFESLSIETTLVLAASAAIGVLALGQSIKQQANTPNTMPELDLDGALEKTKNAPATSSTYEATTPRETPKVESDKIPTRSVTE